MKILIILSLTIFLQANCSQKSIERSNELFYQANQARSAKRQIELLKMALKSCFSYEAEYSLLSLKVTQSATNEEKLRLYDKMLENLSQIENNDALVKAEQEKINHAIALLLKEENPNISAVYEQKANAQEKRKSVKEYTLWILFAFLLFGYVFLGLFRGKS